jgi:hypothetical protein
LVRYLKRIAEISTGSSAEGHDFGRAASKRKTLGLSPCGNTAGLPGVFGVEDTAMRVLMFVAAGFALVGAGIGAGALHARRQAESLLSDLERLDSSTDQLASFSTFGKKHHNQLVAERCTNDLCESEFLVTNWILSDLRLAPRTELRARIVLFRQKPSTANVDYTSATFVRNSPVVHIQEDFCAGRDDIGCNHVALNPHGRNVQPTWNGIVEFGESASAAQKKAAWALNLDCLTAFRGCNGISFLSPEIWSASAPGTVSSCLRSSADALAEASQPLSESCSANGMGKH